MERLLDNHRIPYIMHVPISKLRVECLSSPMYIYPGYTQAYSLYIYIYFIHIYRYIVYTDSYVCNCVEVFCFVSVCGGFV